MPRAARYVALARAIALGSESPSLDASSSESLAGALTFPELDDDNRLFIASSTRALFAASRRARTRRSLASLSATSLSTLSCCDSRPIPEIATELFGGDGEDGAGGDGGDGGDGVGAGEDGEALEATCAAVVASMPEQVAAYRGGRTRAMGSFVGEVMKRTKGRADPRRAAEIIKSLVDQ